MPHKGGDVRIYWGISRDRAIAIGTVIFYFFCCILIVMDPAARQLGTGAKFGLIVLSMTFGILLLAGTVVERFPEDEEEDPDYRRP